MDQLVFINAQRAVVVVELGQHVLASHVGRQIVEPVERLHLVDECLRDHVALNALEIEVVVDILHQVAGIAHQQAVALVRGTGHVVAFDEGEGVGVGVADLLGRQFFEPHVEQPDRLCRIPTENILLGCTGEGFAGFRGAQGMLDGVVGVGSGIAQVSVTECFGQQRRYVVRIDTPDLLYVPAWRVDRYQPVSVTVELEVIEQPERLQRVNLCEMDRTLPVEMGQHVEQHHLALVDRPFGQFHVDRIHHQVTIGFLDDARGDRVVLVYGQGETVARQVVDFASVAQNKFGARIFVADKIDGLFQLQRAVHDVFYGQHVVGVGVFAAWQREGDARRIVGFGFQFVDVPFGAQVARVHDPHVRAHAVHLLIEPQGESVVIPVVDDDGVGQYRLQVVPADVAGHRAVRTVVIVPVLGRENARYDHADDRSGYGSHEALASGGPDDQVAHGEYAQADPDAEGVERTRINIVAFARFVGRGVEVNHQRDAHHHEEPHDDREVARIAVELIDQADKTQQEGEEIVGVAPLVIRYFVRQVVLRPEVKLVDPLDAREPVAVGDDRVGRLDVALAPHEIPKEIAPVHVVELVGEEIVEVLAERRLHDYQRFVARTVVPKRPASEIEHFDLVRASLRVADDFAVFIPFVIGPGAVGAP